VVAPAGATTKSGGTSTAGESTIADVNVGDVTLNDATTTSAKSTKVQTHTRSKQWLFLHFVIVQLLLVLLYYSWFARSWHWQQLQPAAHQVKTEQFYQKQKHSVILLHV
jgi:hypothetical protein